MITIKFNRMASVQDPRRVDVWIEDDTDQGAFGYVGEISLSNEEYAKLADLDREGEPIALEVN